MSETSSLSNSRQYILKTIIFGCVLETCLFLLFFFVIYKDNDITSRLIVSGIVTTPISFLLSIICFFVLEGRYQAEIEAQNLLV